MKKTIKPIARDDIVLRLIVPADAPELFRLRNENRECFINPEVVLLTQHKKWLDAYFKKDDDLMFAICCNDEVIGTIALCNITELDAELGRMIVDAKHRHNGIASKAAQIVLDDIAERLLKLQFVYLSVLTDNIAARCLYADLGFRTIGYSATDRDVIAVLKMRKELCPTQLT